MKLRILLVSACLAGCAGCTSLALERHTLSQSASPTDIRFREVMDNLAMVAHNPAALPAYSSIFAGTAQVTDTGQMASTTVLVPSGYSSENIVPQFQRGVLGNWTLDPVNPPEKIEAMRCACRWVIYGPEFGCHDCLGILASPEQSPTPGRHFGVADRLAQLPPGWLHVGRLRDVPVDARYKSHCGDTWVWVTCDGMEGLAGLTLVLQDIARVDINSPTLFFLKPLPAEFDFPTKPIVTPCCTGPYQGKCGYPVAAVFVDPCGKLVPDQPYYKLRTENVGSDSYLRSQISAAGLH